MRLETIITLYPKSYLFQLDLLSQKTKDSKASSTITEILSLQSLLSYLKWISINTFKQPLKNRTLWPASKDISFKTSCLTLPLSKRRYMFLCIRTQLRRIWKLKGIYLRKSSNNWTIVLRGFNPRLLVFRQGLEKTNWTMEAIDICTM